jgi:hypothetical protein
MGNRQWGGGERGGGEFNAEGAKITQRCREEREGEERRGGIIVFGG